MKKLTLALVALVLVCTCAFASISVSAGLGFGGIYEKGDSPVGPAMFASFDYETAYGVSVYDDVAANYITGTVASAHYHSLLKEAKIVLLSENVGAGYTFHFDDFSVMAGAGLDVKCSVNATAKTNTFFVGVNARVKGTYMFNENWGISAILSPSYDLYCKTQAVNSASEKYFTGNAFVGVTYQF